MDGARITQDAVVLIPGIMGTALTDAATGQELWGLKPSSYVRLWSDRADRGLAALALTPAERAGEYGRIEVGGLLRTPAWMPFLAGIEPYTALAKAIVGVLPHEDALLEFGYDWRLPVSVNAARLASVAAEHLARWRSHPAHEEARRLRPDGRPARLVLVAHSMGGLLARTASAQLDVRTVVTLGTPFEGAAQAAVILSTGRGGPVPLPRARMRDLASTLPGLHDLLPAYRCVDLGDDVRAMTAADVIALGGDGELFHGPVGTPALPDHRLVVGSDQSTVQALRLADGVAHGSADSFGVNADGTLLRDVSGALVRRPALGDGTVPLNSASIDGPTPQPLPQQHGSLAKTPEAIAVVLNALTEERLPGARLGGSELGMSAPDLIAPGAELAVDITGAAPNEVRCTLHDAATNAQVAVLRASRRAGAVVAAGPAPAPGLYRLQLAGGGGSPVTQLVLVAADG